MKALCVILLAAFALVAYGCREFMQDEQRSRLEGQQWMQFSAQHHCTITHQAGFWEAFDLWQCDGGFQVRRRSSEQ